METWPLAQLREGGPQAIVGGAALSDGHMAGGGGSATHLTSESGGQKWPWGGSAAVLSLGIGSCLLWLEGVGDGMQKQVRGSVKGEEARGPPGVRQVRSYLWEWSSGSAMVVVTMSRGRAT